MRLRTIIPRLRNDTYATGVWSCATAEFIVDRELMHHIIQSFLPSSLIVVISWFSFWLDVESVPATQNSAERMTLPQSSYVKASDVFGGACMAFVFSAMIEFTIVNYCTRRKHSSERLTSRVDHGEDKSIYETHSSPYSKRMLLQEQTLQVSDIDHYATDGTETTINGGTAFRGIKLEEDNEESKSDQPVMFRKIPSFASFSITKNSASRKEDGGKTPRVELNRKEAQSIDRKCRVYFPLAFLLFNICYCSAASMLPRTDSFPVSEFIFRLLFRQLKAEQPVIGSQIAIKGNSHTSTISSPQQPIKGSTSISNSQSQTLYPKASIINQPVLTPEAKRRFIFSGFELINAETSNVLCHRTVVSPAGFVLRLYGIGQVQSVGIYPVQSPASGLSIQNSVQQLRQFSSSMQQWESIQLQCQSSVSAREVQSVASSQRFSAKLQKRNCQICCSYSIYWSVHLLALMVSSYFQDFQLVFPASSQEEELPAAQSPDS
uniref:Neurotransmitter-gated ion-channel transmembrane domain-containing protein n=1 Tax=Ditylenchus dipsaci TaxID=166011 RepID=A0A915EDZ8_9BILA